VCAIEAFYKLPAARVHLIYISLDTPRRMSCANKTHTNSFETTLRVHLSVIIFYSLDKNDLKLNAGYKLDL
jgi:hypothetical protein